MFRWLRKINEHSNGGKIPQRSRDLSLQAKEIVILQAKFLKLVGLLSKR